MAVRQRIADALDAPSADEQAQLERLAHALNELSQEVEKIVEGGTEDLNDVRVTARTLERALARVRETATMDDVPGLVTAWIDAKVAATTADASQTASDSPTRESLGVSDEADAATESRAAPADEASATALGSEPSLASELALEALRESLAELRTFVDRRGGLLSRLQAIQDSHAELAERLDRLVEEAKRSESELRRFEASERTVMEKRQEFLRAVGERTEEVAAKVMQSALAAKIDKYRDALDQAQIHVGTFKSSHRQAGDARREATGKIEKARRSLATSQEAYTAAVEAVREGARGAKLPIRRGPEGSRQGTTEEGADRLRTDTPQPTRDAGRRS